MSEKPNSHAEWAEPYELLIKRMLALGERELPEGFMFSVTLYRDAHTSYQSLSFGRRRESSSDSGNISGPASEINC